MRSGLRWAVSGLLGLLVLGGWLVVESRSEEARMAERPRLYRVILPVADIEKAARFYTELLGITGLRISGGRHYFDCGGVILALFAPRADGDKFDARPNQEHVYFAVANLEAVYERAQRLGGLSTEIGDGGLPMGKIAMRPWGERSFYLKDQFGNPLCFVDQKTLFTGR